MFGIPSLGTELLTLPPYQSVTRILTEAEVRGLFTSPITLIPASTGKLIRPEKIDLWREAGTVYTGNASTGNVQIFCGGGSWYNLSGMAATLFGVAGPVKIILLEPATVGGVIFSSIDFGNVSQSLGIKYATADMTGGTGRLFITIHYRLWDNSQGLA